MKLIPTAMLGRFTSAVSHAARSAVLINILLEKLVTTNTALHDEENYISDKNTIVKMYFKCYVKVHFLTINLNDTYLKTLYPFNFIVQE